jgi:hypothetical protein
LLQFGRSTSTGFFPGGDIFAFSHPVAEMAGFRNFGRRAIYLESAIQTFALPAGKDLSPRRLRGEILFSRGHAAPGVL